MMYYRDLKALELKNPELREICDLCRRTFSNRSSQSLSIVEPYIELFAEVLKFNHKFSRSFQHEIVSQWPARLKEVADCKDNIQAGIELLRAARHVASTLSIKGISAIVSLIGESKNNLQSIQQFSRALLCHDKPKDYLTNASVQWGDIKILRSELPPNISGQLEARYFSRIQEGELITTDDFLDCLEYPMFAQTLIQSSDQKSQPYSANLAKLHALAEDVSARVSQLNELSILHDLDPFWELEHSISNAVIKHPEKLKEILELLINACVDDKDRRDNVFDIVHALRSGWHFDSVSRAFEMYKTDRIRISETSRYVGALNIEFNDVLKTYDQRGKIERYAIERGLANIQQAIADFAQNHKGFKEEFSINTCAHLARYLIARDEFDPEKIKCLVALIKEVGLSKPFFSKDREPFETLYRALDAIKKLEDQRIPFESAVRLSTFYLMIPNSETAQNSDQFRLACRVAREPEILNKWKSADRWDSLSPHFERWLNHNQLLDRALLNWTCRYIIREGECRQIFPRGITAEIADKINPKVAINIKESEGADLTLAKLLQTIRLNNFISKNYSKETLLTQFHRNILDYINNQWSLDQWPVARAKMKAWTNEEIPNKKGSLFVNAFRFLLSEENKDIDLSESKDAQRAFGAINSEAEINFISAVHNFNIKSASHLVEYLIALHQAAETTAFRDQLERYIWNELDLSSDLGHAFYQYHHDTVAYDLTDPRAIKAQSEVIEVLRRCFELHRGFGAMTIEARRPYTYTKSLIHQFAEECFVSAGVLNSPNVINLPGPGFMLSGMKLGRLLVASEQYPEDPYIEYKLAWSWLANELSDLEVSKILYTRGFFVIIGPEKEGYFLPGENAPTHYSLVICNDHFNNDFGYVAYLVPTVVISECLKGKIVPLKQYEGEFNPAYQSSAESFSIELLRTLSRRRGFNMLNLGWASNVAGFSNAYPPESAPYHQWERALSHHTKDRAGHVHKSHILGRYMNSMTPELEEAFVPLREAHDGVYTIATKYFNLHDAFRLCRAIWHKDMDLPEELGEFEEQDPELDDRGNQRTVLRARMLKQAYDFHYNHELGEINKLLFPQLVVTSALDYASRPESSIVLDTYNMVLRLADGRRIQLPRDSDGTGEEELQIWSQYVVPHISHSINDLRFYLPVELGIID